MNVRENAWLMARSRAELVRRVLGRQSRKVVTAAFGVDAKLQAIGYAGSRSEDRRAWQIGHRRLYGLPADYRELRMWGGHHEKDGDPLPAAKASAVFDTSRRRRATQSRYFQPPVHEALPGHPLSGRTIKHDQRYSSASAAPRISAVGPLRRTTPERITWPY